MSEIEALQTLWDLHGFDVENPDGTMTAGIVELLDDGYYVTFKDSRDCCDLVPLGDTPDDVRDNIERLECELPMLWTLGDMLRADRLLESVSALMEPADW